MSTKFSPVILHEGLPIAQAEDPMRFLLNHQAQSTLYALEHGGYAIVEDEGGISQNVVRGWVEFMRIAGRPADSVTGWAVHSMVDMQGLAIKTDPGVTTDYLLAEEIVTPALKAIRYSLNYLDGPVSAIAGELDSWVMSTAKRFGLDPDNI